MANVDLLAAKKKTKLFYILVQHFTSIDEDHKGNTANKNVFNKYCNNYSYNNYNKKQFIIIYRKNNK